MKRVLDNIFKEARNNKGMKSSSLDSSGPQYIEFNSLNTKNHINLIIKMEKALRLLPPDEAL